MSAKIKNATGDNSLVFALDPDFEGILGLQNKQLQDKINLAQTLTIAAIPKILNDAINKLVSF